MTLRINLRDGEKVVVNGAVLRAVGRTEICVESSASVLRGREIMAPADADTPARQLYFHTMMAYIDPENMEAHQDRIVTALQQVSTLLPSEEGRAAAVSFARQVASLRYYRALADCRTLMRLEDAVLAPATAAAAD